MSSALERRYHDERHAGFDSSHGSSAGVDVHATAVCPCGSKELYVIDPHGDPLEFGQSA